VRSNSSPPFKCQVASKNPGRRGSGWRPRRSLARPPFRRSEISSGRQGSERRSDRLVEQEAPQRTHTTVAIPCWDSNCRVCPLLSASQASARALHWPEHAACKVRSCALRQVFTLDRHFWHMIVPPTVAKSWRCCSGTRGFLEVSLRRPPENLRASTRPASP